MSCKCKIAAAALAVGLLAAAPAMATVTVTFSPVNSVVVVGNTVDVQIIATTDDPMLGWGVDFFNFDDGIA